MYRLFYKYIYTLSTYYIIKERERGGERERETDHKWNLFLFNWRWNSCFVKLMYRSTLFSVHCTVYTNVEWFWNFNSATISIGYLLYVGPIKLLPPILKFVKIGFQRSNTLKTVNTFQKWPLMCPWLHSRHPLLSISQYSTELRKI